MAKSQTMFKLYWLKTSVAVERLESTDLNLSPGKGPYRVMQHTLKPMYMQITFNFSNSHSIQVTMVTLALNVFFFPLLL